MLGGCSSSPMRRLYRTIEFAANTGGGDDIDFKHFLNMPYATMAAKLGRSQMSVVVLGQVLQDELYWFTADKAALVTRNGRLVKTAGFPENLLRSTFPVADPLTRLPPFGNAPSTAIRMLDIERGNFFGLVVHSTYVDLGEQEVILPGGSRRLRGWREECEAPLIRWSFTNEFWLDPATGQVWKSIQHYLPDMPPFELRVIKPAGIA